MTHTPLITQRNPKTTHYHQQTVYNAPTTTTQKNSSLTHNLPQPRTNRNDQLSPGKIQQQSITTHYHQEKYYSDSQLLTIIQKNPTIFPNDQLLPK